MSQTIITLPVRDDVNRRLRESLKAAGLPWLPIYGMSDLPRARSLLITRALRLGADVVVFIDADIIASHEQILALSKHPRLSSEGAVTGLYSARGGQAWACDADPDRPEPDGCLPARTAGLGFAVVTRESLLRVGETLPELEDEGETWRPYCLPFIGEYEGCPKYFAEDIALWKRLSTTGTRLWADPALTVGHLTELPIFAPFIPRPSSDTREPRTRAR